MTPVIGSGAVVPLISALALLVAALTFLIAALTFWKNSRVRRAEWLVKLYEKYYENPDWKKIRRGLDTPAKEEMLENLRTEVDPDALESFADYLNFFEFLGSLRELKQIRKKEIGMMFDYYVRQLDDERIRTFCSQYGYENALKLVNTIPS